MHSDPAPAAAVQRQRPAAISLALRPVLLLHRYLAVVIGLLMSLWCLSGFVMMYQGYPELTQAERLHGLEPLNFSVCCNEATAALGKPADFRIQMRAGEPVIGFGRSGAVSMRTGLAPAELSQTEVLAVAEQYAARHGIDGNATIAGTGMDQWTVAIAWEFPTLYRVQFDDPAHTHLYVPASSAQVILDTSRRERVLSWFGAIPHWLYPMQLRKNGPLWSNIVIWTSVAGTFLALTGLYVGISRTRRRNPGSPPAEARQDGSAWSPFTGWWYWHHMLGLVFGVLVLTWVFSGLLTMGPWGLLVPDGERPDYRNQVQGVPPPAQLARFLSALSDGALPDGEFVELRAAPFDGELYVLAMRQDGSRIRLDASGQPDALSSEDVRQAVSTLNSGINSFDVLNEEDHYYYGHRQAVDLPVYRVALQDSDSTLLYINSTSGAVQIVDSTQRLARWLREGLHDLDFAGLRIRPVWDIVVLLLLSGVTLVCVSGSWMALRRLQFDCRRLLRKFITSRQDSL